MFIIYLSLILYSTAIIACPSGTTISPLGNCVTCPPHFYCPSFQNGGAPYHIQCPSGFYCPIGYVISTTSMRSLNTMF